MENQKLENLLNLALSVDEAERERSMQLNVGYIPESRSWELIVKYSGNIGRLSGGLIQVEELIAGYAIVTVPENLIDAFAQMEEVEYVEKPKRLYFSTWQGRQASCILPVTAGEPYLTGNGVLIGIIDSGIDYTSPEFMSSAGGTRIQYLWDQTLSPEQGTPPEGFTQGVEFDKNRLDQALSLRDPLSMVPSTDRSGHGTAVAGIAAASGNAADGRYRGVAPESDLIVVKLGTSRPDSFPRTTELMRALTYVIKKALEMGRPIAVNLSFGNTYGSHDGNSLVERFLDNVAEIGKTTVCVGSGNEGAVGGHVSGSLRGDGTGTATARAELNVGNYQTAFGVQLWKEYADRYRVTMISPSGIRQEIDTLRTGIQRIVMENTEILLYIGEPSPYSVSQELYFDMIPRGTYVDSGIWSFELTAERVALGNYDFYLPSSNVLNAATRFFTPTAAKTLTIPSTASRVITVGAYDAVYESYADFSGRGYLLEGSVGGRINVNSIKPDLVAPGVNIQTIGPDNTFVQVSGTSFATPFVTGAAALLMEWGIVRGNDPYLYGEKIKAYLRKGARPLRGESVYPNDRVGYGALCVAESIISTPFSETPSQSI